MKSLRLLKKFLASSLTFALIALSPGLAPYEALAQVVPVEGTPLAATPLPSPASAGEGQGGGSLENLPAQLPTGDLSIPLTQDGLNAVSLPSESLGRDLDTLRELSSVLTPDSLSRRKAGEGDAAEGRRRVRADAIRNESTRHAALSNLFDRVSTELSAVPASDATLLAVPEQPEEGARHPDTLSGEEESSQQPTRGPVFIEHEGRPDRGGPDSTSESRDDRSTIDHVHTLGGSGFSGDTKRTLLIGAAIGGAMLVLQVVAGAPLSSILGRMVGGGLAWAATVLPSLAFHEWAHAKSADMLGDSTARLEGRLTLKPWKHIDPVGTVLIPAAALLMGWPVIGWAKPVPFNPYGLKKASSARVGSALVAAAGPAMNLGIAVAGAVAYRVLSPILGVYGFIPSMFAVMVDLNVLLAVFNMLPIPPADGHKVFRLIPGVGPYLDRIPPDIGRWVSFALLMFPLTAGPILGLVGTIDHLLISAPVFGHTAFSMAGAALALASIPVAPLGNKEIPVQKATSVPAAPAVDLIVKLPARQVLTQDVIPNLFNPNQPKSVKLYRAARESMLRDLERSGLDEALLRRFNAEPQSAFRRVSMVTVRLDADKEAAFTSELTSRGFTVYKNERIRLPKPVTPQDHPARKTINTDQLLDVLNARPVHKILKDRLGPPELNGQTGFAGRLTRFLMRLGGVKNPDVKIGVIDSGVDENASPALKRAVKNKLNATSGENIDDIGHGTHVTDTAVALDPWQTNVTMIKAFVDGSGSREDILKALTMAGNEGLLIIGNSWGDGVGDPASPESQLVLQLAKEGHILVFAAGNEGPDKNTIGAPAIVAYLSPETNAPRVISVAAADYRKMIASFSSRGEGSGVTKDTPGYPVRPDVTAMGVDLEASVPGGRKEVMSGTSMATPNVWGEISLHARTFGVTAVGEALDKIAKATVESSVDTGRPAYEQGKGFRDVLAAHKAISASGLSLGKSLMPRGLRRLAIRAAWAVAKTNDARLKKLTLNALALLGGALAYFLLAHNAYAGVASMAVLGSLSPEPTPGPEARLQAAAAALPVDEVGAFRHLLFGFRLRAEQSLSDASTPKNAARDIAQKADKLAGFFERAKNKDNAQALLDIRSVLDRVAAKVNASAGSAADMDAFRADVRKTLDALQSAASKAKDRPSMLAKFDEILGGKTPSSVELAEARHERLQWLGVVLVLLVALAAAGLFAWAAGNWMQQTLAPLNDPANWHNEMEP